MRQARNERSFRFTVYHETEESALKEANRLCNICKTERFLVLQVKHFVDGEQ